jgi:N-acetylmuramoyl-L-alanine amidase
MATTLYKRGSRGAVVKQIQKALGLYPDGIFGSLTEERVTDYQRTHGLKPDGIVGPATLARLLPATVATALHLRKSRRTINEIIIHCTATPEGRDMTVDEIRRQHTAPVSRGGRGWSDIGYHYVIYRDGTIHEGRNIDLIGAHCAGHNSHSIGIAYVGGLENRPSVAYAHLRPKDTRTEEQRASLLSLLLDLRKLYPSAKIHGHRDFANKACPSFDATTEYRHV